MPTVDHRLGRALSRLRIEAGLSQLDLAQSLKVSQTTVSRWEAGAPMTAATAWAATEAMGLPPWLLFAMAAAEQDYVVAPGMLATVKALLTKPAGDTIPR